MDATAVTIDEFSSMTERVDSITKKGGRAIVAVDNPADSPVAVPLVRATDEALLVVTLEYSSIREARAAIARFGIDRFLGALTLRPRRGRAARRAGAEGDALVIFEPAWAASAPSSAGEVGGVSRSEPGGRSV